MARRRPGPAIAADTAAPQPQARSLWWLQGLVCGAVVVLATPVALAGGVLLAPGFLGLAVDQQDGRPVARAMLLFGAAWCCLPLWHLWVSGHTLADALHLLADPSTLAGAWLAGGCGWLLAELVPLFLRVAFDLHARSRAATLRAERAGLESEWGIPPARDTQYQ